MSTNPLFLGLDLSTQQLKSIVLSQDSSIVHETSVHFDRDLPHYGTVNGAIRGPSSGEVTSPVEMWLEAIDLLFQRLKADQVDFGAISAISGAGQQHGSVYWSNNAASCLSNLDSNQALAAQLFPAAFSMARAPIWQDSSTTEYCRRLEEIFGGAQALADCTGSRAYERFTGNQIARIFRLYPDVYISTSRISLVSSFLPSLFLGAIAPIEISDASGMNLMDVLTCKWDDRLLNICGGTTLRSKLGPEPISGGTTLGTICDWWIKRWGFRSNCIIAPFTGDNSATVVSLSAPGDALLSLGTSTTFLLSIPPSSTPPKRTTTSHLLSHPADPSGKIAMLCYKNGALPREQIRDRFASGDWKIFNNLVEQCPPGCNGYMGFYFPLPEIIPPGVVGEYYFFVNDQISSSKIPLPVKDMPESVHPRAIIESQLLSIKSRIATILPENSLPLKRLVITGGGSANETIRQMIADVFAMDVYISSTKEAAGMGGALLAKYALWKKSNPGKFEDMGASDVAIRLECVAKPRSEHRKVYDSIVGVYDTLEARVLTQLTRRGSRPPTQEAGVEGAGVLVQAVVYLDSEKATQNRPLPAKLEGLPACTSRHLRLSFLRVRNLQHHLLPKFLSSTMSDSPDLQPLKRMLLPEDSETLSKKPRLVEEPKQSESKAMRLPKRHCALLLGFCGSGYRGMQIQPGPIPLTIENILFNALVKVGAVSQDNADNPTKVGIARAARTDAGVHAAGNVVTLKMIITIPGVDDLIASINEQLPPAIRVWGYGRVQKSFNARLSCESRKYTYFFPTYLLIPPKPGSGIHRALADQIAQDPDAPPTPVSDFWELDSNGSREEDLVRKRSWRVSQEQVQSLRNIVELFEGTHNFHNFTAGRDSSDPSCRRHMKKIQVSDPVVYGETEWISVLFHGQSFMLHQRKMMAILVLSCRFGTPIKIIKELYRHKTVFIPKMPALGLLLEEPLFDSYNERMATLNEKLQPTDADYRPAIDFDIHREKMNAFKEEYIYSNMRKVEDRDGLFDAWVRSLDFYSGNDLLYLSPSGTIPDAAVIEKGVKREKPFREMKVFDSTSFPDKNKLVDNEELSGADDEDEDLPPINKRDLAEMDG